MKEFDEHELRAIGMMARMSKTLPQDMMAVGIMQELACLYVKIEPLLNDDQRAVLLGAGAYMAKQGRDELSAEIQAGMAISKVRQRRREGGGK